MEENNKQVLAAAPQVTKEQFLQHIADMLAGYQWPAGSIECIDPSKARTVYLWGHHFKGVAEGSWSAKVNAEVTVTYGDKERKVSPGTPYSGVLPEVSFDVAVINDDENTPYWAKDFAKTGFAVENLQPLSFVQGSGATVEGKDSDKAYNAWMKNGNEIVDNFLRGCAEMLSQNTAVAYVALDLIPAEVVQKSPEMFANSKFSSTDAKASTRNSVTEDPTAVLIPFHVLEFQFEGKQYHLAMMADGDAMMKGKVPPVQDNSRTPEEIVNEELADQVKTAKYAKWGGCVAVVITVVLLGLIAGLIIAVGAYGVNWYMNRPIKERLKQLEQQKADGQKALAEKLRKQLLG